MAIKLGDLIATLSLDDKLSKNLDEVSHKFKDFGKSMLHVTAEIGLVGGAGFKMANDLNKAMADVASLMPGNAARVREMKDAMLEVGHVTGKSGVEMAKGLYQVVSANVAANDQLKVLEISAKAGAAGLATTREAIDLLSLVTKGYGDQSTEAYQKVADLSLLTVRLGKTTFPELAGSMGTVTPIAAALNVRQEELFASFATLVGVTGDANEVATQLKSTMSDMMKPSEEMSAAIAKLGFSGVEAMVSQLGLVDAVRALASTTDGTVEQMGKLFNNVRALPAVFALTQGQAETFNQKLKEMEGFAGVTEAAFEEQAHGINAAGFAWEQFEHALAGVERAIGEAIAPTLVKLMHIGEGVIAWVKDIIKWFSLLPAPVKDIVVGMLAFIATIGPAAYAIGGLIGTLKTISTVLKVNMLGVLGQATLAVGAFIAVFKVTSWILDWVPGLRKVTTALTDFAMKLFGIQGLLDMYNKHLEKGKDVTKGWSDEEKKALENFKAAQAIEKETAAAFDAVAEKTKKVTDETTKLNDATKKSTVVTEADIAAKLKATKTADLLAKATEIYGQQVVDPKLAARIVAMAEAQENAAKASDEYGKKMLELSKVVPEMGVGLESVGHSLAGISKWEPPEIGKLGQTMTEMDMLTQGSYINLVRMAEQYSKIGLSAEQLTQKLIAAGVPAEQAKQIVAGLAANIHEAEVRAGKVAGATRDWAKEFSRIAEGMAMLASIGGPLGEIANMIGAAAQSTSTYNDRMKTLNEQALKPNLTETEKDTIAHEKFVAKVDLAAAAASMLGGALAKSTNATVAQAGAALQGAAAGAKMGASFGPIGAGIGAAVGGIMGFISAGKKLKAEVTKLYDEFVKSAGGMEKLKARAESAGVSLEAVFKNKGTKNVEAMKKAIEEANEKMDAFDDLLSAVSAKTLEELTAKAAEAGVSLQALWDAQTVEEYKAAVDSIKGSMDMFKQAQDALNEAMDRYGISIEQLGPKFAQQKLDEQALQLLQDWRILAAAGVDINLLIEKMGPNMNDFVNTAIKAGATIPEAMRPVIEQMIASGQLLDENGKAYESVEAAGITFGKTQSEMFDMLIEKIEALVNALLGIPSSVPPIHVPVTYDDPGYPGGGGGGGSGGSHDREMATGGIVNAPTVALLGERGREAVIPLDEGGFGVQTIHVPISLEGRVVAEVLLRRNKAGFFKLVQ